MKTKKKQPKKDTRTRSWLRGILCQKRKNENFTQHFFLVYKLLQKRRLLKK